MASVAYRCCRCSLPLRTAARSQPWPCDAGCGEWLTLEAIDEHLFPQLVLFIAREPSDDAPRCVFCDAALRSLLSEPFHMCVDHGVWFDQDERKSFSRVLSAEIAKHRATRRRRQTFLARRMRDLTTCGQVLRQFARKLIPRSRRRNDHRTEHTELN